MIPKISVDVVSNIAKNLAEISEIAYKTQNMSFFQQEFQNMDDKQPYLSGWFNLYCQLCRKQGMSDPEISIMGIAFLVILKSLYAQSEVNNLNKLFGNSGK